MDTKEAITFGIFTDLHCSHRQDDGTRFFSRSLSKLKKCYCIFEKEQIDFAACLGDLTDYESVGSKQITVESDNLEDELQSVIQAASFPFYLCLGNHDVFNLQRNSLLALSSKMDIRGNSGASGIRTAAS